MTDKSNFEKIHITQEDRKKLLQARGEKKMDFYLALAKLTYTALVLGVVVGCIQSKDEIGLLHIS